jgi:hypothetical protein
VPIEDISIPTYMLPLAALHSCRLRRDVSSGASMRLVWTGEQPAAEAQRVLVERGYDTAQLGLSEHAHSRITRRFPVLISRSGRFIEEAFSFFLDVAFVRGSARSIRTLETYAESLQSWLTYAERKDLQWRRPTAVMLAAYRDHLLETDGVDRRTRPLSCRTVNLPLTVAIEFYKHSRMGHIRRVHSQISRSSLATCTRMSPTPATRVRMPSIAA